jgi:hypothetical protein
MRWRFPHPSESAARETVLANIDAWWRAFIEEVPRLEAFFRGRERWDLAGWMRTHLGAVDERIMWEFGPGTSSADGNRLVLTPEMDRQVRPLVEVVLARAPVIAGWEFHAHRLAESLPAALQTVLSRTAIDLTAFRARTDVSGDGLVDIVFSPPSGRLPDAEVRAAALLLVEALVGEELMDVWVGAVEVISSAPGEPLFELETSVRGLVGALGARIPELPYWKRATDGPWTMLRLQPRTGVADDYAGQQDMLIAKTMDLALWKAQHGQRPFFSRRFSRWGELMCTLKIDGVDGLAEGGLGDKASIEDAIVGALEPAGLGGHIGGGTGLRYSYIDLALTDAPAAMKVMQTVLRAGKLPRRTWLQFFDADLADEWIPLWDDAPPPPR